MIARRYPVVLSEKGKRLKNRAAYFGVFAALALILSYVETLIPVNFGIPGAKLGLANLVIVVVLYKTDFKEALLLSVTRVVLAGFIFGNLYRAAAQNHIRLDTIFLQLFNRMLGWLGF